MTTITIPDPATLSRQERFALWLRIGRERLHLPIDELTEAIAIEMRAGKRARGRSRTPLSLAERLRLATLCRVVGGAILSFFTDWVLSPKALIRFAKRFQERQAQADKGGPQGPGRPRAGQEKVRAVLRIHGEGIVGLKRIQGELKKCGMDLATATIRRILEDHGLRPDGHAGKPGSTWTTFWRNHAHKIVGVDYLQVATGLMGRAIRYSFALVGIEHDTRRAHLLGVTENPTDEWLKNRLRHATGDGEALEDRKYWIHDNDGKFQTLPGILMILGKQSVRTAIQAPDMNAFIERFFRSARQECLDHIILFSPEHLEQVLGEYLEHYNTQRPHQGIGNVPIGPWEIGQGEIVCDEGLGGLLKSFRRAA